MAASVVLPARWISAITARIVALAFVACSDLAARARAAVLTLPAVPSFRPPRLPAARADEALERGRRPKCERFWTLPSRCCASSIQFATTGADSRAGHGV